MNLVWSVLWSVIAGASSGVSAEATFLHCDYLLRSPAARAHQERVARIFNEDQDVEVSAVVGVSNRDLIHLLNTGELEAGVDKLFPFVIEGSPAVREYKNKHPHSFVEAYPLAEQEARAEAQSWARGTADLLEQRLGSGVDVRGERFLDFLARLRRREPGSGTFSPTYARIYQAATESNLPKNNVVNFPKLFTLAKRLNLEWSSPEEVESPLRPQLLGAFADLPRRSGFTLLMKPRSLTKFSFSTRHDVHVRRITIDDLAGIEPNADPEFEFLSNLTQTESASR